MGNEAPNTEPVVDSSSVVTSAEPENTTVSEPQPAAEPQQPASDDSKQTDVVIPSIEGDPWANFGKEEGSTPETDKAQPEVSDKPAATEPEKKADDSATPDPAKAEEKPKVEEKTEEKPLEDQALEEAFGEKSPKTDEDPKAKDPAKLTDEDLDKLDPAEMIAAQTKAASKRWAQRNATRAAIVNDFIHDTRPIAEIDAELRQLNPDRHTALSQHAAHQLVDANPEQTFQRAFAVEMMKSNPFFQPTPENIPSLQEVIQWKRAGGAVPAPAGESSNGNRAIADQITELELALEGHDWRDPAQDAQLLDDRERALVKTLRGLEQLIPAAPAEQKPAEEKPATEPDPETRKAVEAGLDTRILEFRSSLSSKVLPWIAKNTGLEISPEDTPEVADFKRALFVHYEGTPYQKANNLDSDFEVFATNESSVAEELNEVYSEVTDLLLKAEIAERQGDKAAAKKHIEDARKLNVDVINLFGQANDEFKKLRIEPHLKLMGSLSTSLTQKVIEASERTEIVNNGGQAPAQPRTKKEADTADGVWDRMVDEAAEDDRLRAA